MKKPFWTNFVLLILIGLGSCTSQGSRTQFANFFPIDGFWNLRKVECPMSPIQPQGVEQINFRLANKRLYYMMSVKGREMKIQQRHFPETFEHGFCESEINVRLKEVPSGLIRVETVSIDYQRAVGVEQKKCPVRADISAQKDSSFELKQSSLRVFQLDSLDSKKICAGSGPLVSVFDRIF